MSQNINNINNEATVGAVAQLAQLGAGAVGAVKGAYAQHKAQKKAKKEKEEDLKMKEETDCEFSKSESDGSRSPWAHESMGLYIYEYISPNNRLRFGFHACFLVACRPFRRRCSPPGLT